MSIQVSVYPFDAQPDHSEYEERLKKYQDYESWRESVHHPTEFHKVWPKGRFWKILATITVVSGLFVILNDGPASLFYNLFIMFLLPAIVTIFIMGIYYVNFWMNRGSLIGITSEGFWQKPKEPAVKPVLNDERHVDKHKETLTTINAGDITSLARPSIFFDTIENITALKAQGIFLIPSSANKIKDYVESISESHPIHGVNREIFDFYVVYEKSLSAWGLFLAPPKSPRNFTYYRPLAFFFDVDDLQVILDSMQYGLLEVYLGKTAEEDYLERERAGEILQKSIQGVILKDNFYTQIDEVPHEQQFVSVS